MNTSCNSDIPASQKQMLDARLIFLGSRKVGQGMPQGNFENNHYCIFSYYDTITVEKVDLNGIDVNPLWKAYEVASTRSKNDGQVQCIPAFLDIATDERVGYLPTEIESFWEDKNCPLMFMTLINLGAEQDIKIALQKVKELFPRGSHLAYFSFDHSDLILFCRGYSFEEYAKQVFAFAYQSKLEVVDTITLYSFCHVDQEKSEEEIPFHAFIRFGVQDYTASETFFEELQRIGKQFKKVWLLGRNDMGVYCEAATLSWLASLRDIALQQPNKHWYTTYDLIVPIETAEIESNAAPEITDVSILQQRMRLAFKEFKDIYISVYKELGLQFDNIWLRWLEESSELSVSLLSSVLSNDLGLCLACQFLDYFAYGKKFFQSTYFQPLNCAEDDNITLERIIEKKRDCLEKMEKSFSNFFADMAILIDSMNQTDRQFVQVPAFHLPSFEIPPKIMALYVTVANRLRDVLHDDDQATYGLVLLPKFNQNLGIFSLANQNVLAEDQWLEIMISEPSFYSMRRTIQAMGHEISHFVGQKNRCRKERKIHMMKCALALYIVELLKALPNEVYMTYPHPKDDKWKVEEGAYSLKAILDATDKLYVASTELAPTCFTLGERRKEVMGALEKLLHDFVVQQEPFTALARELLHLERFENEATDSVLDYLQNHIVWLYSIEKDPEDLEGEFGRQTRAACTRLLESEFYSLVDNIANRLCLWTESDKQIYNSENYAEVEGAQIQYLFSRMSEQFSETFADLQMILLFQMSWQDYCTQLKRQDFSLVADCPLRMLAVAKALVAEKVWRSEDINGLEDQYKQLEDAVRLDIFSDDKELDDKGYNSILLFYLSMYLKACVKTIQENFNKAEIKEQIDQLRIIHKSLSNQTPILTLENELRLYVKDFRKKLLGE